MYACIIFHNNMIIEDDKDLNLQLLFDYPTLKLYN